MKYIFLIVLIFLTGCSTKHLNEQINDIAIEQKVDPLVIKSICYMESGLKPLAINVNKSLFNIQQGPHFFDTSIGANIYMDTVLDPLGLNYDIGLCQINKQHLNKFEIDNEDLLDSEINIEIASKIHYLNMKACQQNLICALSLYNTGKKNSIQGLAYAKKVLNIKKKKFNK